MGVYKASYFTTFFGYFLALLDFVGLGVIIQALIHDRKAHPLMTTGLQAMFYGLYFGVLTRDLAEICAMAMASNIGYHTPGKMPNKTLPSDVCGICGDGMQSA
jgi:RING finger protein 121